MQPDSALCGPTVGATQPVRTRVWVPNKATSELFPPSLQPNRKIEANEHHLNLDLPRPKVIFDVMDGDLGSVGSTLSWNTVLSRTSVSTLTCAIFSERQSHSVHGLEDVIRAVGSLQLRRYRYEELSREETLGQGETYLVEKAIQGGTAVAIKHLKISNNPDQKAFRRRLTAVTVEARIMRHSPLRAHPNLPNIVGYGWNLRGELIMPFLVVEYTPLGTLREYIQKIAPMLSDIEILLSDVASALAALHVCGIIHGDVKLDNVLMFPSMDRPVKALAKLTDFGHALILNIKSKKQADETIKYGGTLIYNAPEVRCQDLFPIDRTEVSKCDLWAFGLLVWEACIGGEEYVKYLARSGITVNTSSNDLDVSAADMLHHAKRCLPNGKLGAVMFLRIVLHKTIQEDPMKRATSIRDLPLSARWKTGDLLGLEADLALHFETSTPTYEMFSLDNGKEISWDHQRQIFQGFKQAHTNNTSSQQGLISWQIALCYHVGFGTVQDAQNAHKYSEIAKSEFHPLAMAFGHFLDPSENSLSKTLDEDYATKVSSLLHSNAHFSEAMPSLVKAFFDGDSLAIFDLLSKGVSLSSCSVDGCSPFHWLFMFQDTALKEIVSNFSGKLDRRLVNLPMCSKGSVHDQWPLNLSGSPLAVAISVNSLPAVKALLLLGADPLSLVYDRRQFSSNDSRSQWTAFHIAAKYHCSEILTLLLEQTTSRQQTSIKSLLCVLGSSTALERLAMHGSNHTEKLDETIRLIRGIQPLEAMDMSGRTGLMMAIDVQDYHVIAALLRSEKGLAEMPFRSPASQDIYTYPIHYSAQIGARRDVPETLAIPKLLHSYAVGVSSKTFSRDSMGRTPLHLAVTGPSTAVAGWMLEENVELLHIEDVLGRTPLYYCASSANVNLLLKKGADVNHVDKKGATALHRACYIGESDLVTCLLLWKPRLDFRDDIFGTPLHCGVISGAIDVVMALVEAGASLNAVDVNGNTAVHVAAKLNRQSILRLLIRQGADISLRNINGRDQKAISRHAAKGFSMLNILQHESRDSHGSQSILENIDDDRKTSGSGYQSTRNLSPDFLWEEKYMSVAEPEESTNLWQSADDDLYSYGRQQETYDQRERKLEKLDQIISTVTQYVPILCRKNEAATAVLTLLSVFFDDVIWQPGIASQIIEVIARAAHDLACITQFYTEKARSIEQRGEAWARFLTMHDGILVGNKERLAWFWKHMQEHDPVGTSHQAGMWPEYWPNKTWRLADGDLLQEQVCPFDYLKEQISLQLLLQRMEEKFPLRPVSEVVVVKEREEGRPEDWTSLRARWRVEHRRKEEFRREIQTERKIQKRQEERRRKLEEGQRKSGPDGATREGLKKGPQAEGLKLDDSSRHEAKSYFDHVNLAIGWITNIVMDRKPRTVFPGRQNSDIQDMARWEVERWKMPVPNCEVLQNSTTLFDLFPQLLEQPWRQSFSQEYLKWKHRKAIVLLQEDSRGSWEDRVDLIKTVYSSCTRWIEEG